MTAEERIAAAVGVRDRVQQVHEAAEIVGAPVLDALADMIDLAAAQGRVLRRIRALRDGWDDNGADGVFAWAVVNALDDALDEPEQPEQPTTLDRMAARTLGRFADFVTERFPADVNESEHPIHTAMRLLDRLAADTAPAADVDAMQHHLSVLDSQTCDGCGRRVAAADGRWVHTDTGRQACDADSGMGRVAGYHSVASSLAALYKARERGDGDALGRVGNAILARHRDHTGPEFGDDRWAAYRQGLMDALDIVRAERRRQ